MPVSETMDRTRPFRAHDPRDMRRTTLVGAGPTAPQAADDDRPSPPRAP